ncbi:probable transport accessory protein MmpS3 [Ostrea edulis]|uniref:probable transport accessory protein MmpS3 n=1 Tax=Ostrea edulis TaxID=37623 RepID=UPI0024AEE8AE|nr:probable transport accessory protein MmpS3 [Ostrea edulis]
MIAIKDLDMVGALLSKTFCGEREPRGAYISRGDSLTFRSKSNFYKTDDGFNLLLTPFQKGTCTSSEYRCNAGQCINSRKKCDGYRQCGEYADECKITRTTSWIAGVVVGVIAVIAVIGIAVFCIRRHFINRRSSGGVVKYSSPPQQVTSVPTYQQPGVNTPYPQPVVNPPYQQPGTAPGYYPQGPAPPPQGYPPQNTAYPPPYPEQQQPGYPPATNPYPYGAPTAQ